MNILGLDGKWPIRKSRIIICQDKSTNKLINFSRKELVRLNQSFIFDFFF